MKLGSFSISLNVKDLEVSKLFYENLGFKIFHGDATENWLIMRNETLTIGLFKGMINTNLLTFNPGWDQNCNKLESFQDIRDIQNSLDPQQVKIDQPIDPDSSGPASFMIEDPDGNAIFFDQHV